MKDGNKCMKEEMSVSVTFRYQFNVRSTTMKAQL